MIHTCSKCGEEFGTETRRNTCDDCLAPSPVYGDLVDRLGKPLSAREHHVAQRVAQGLTNKEIAWELKLSTGTIKIYTSHIFAKSGCTNRVQLALWYLREQSSSMVQQQDNPVSPALAQ